MVAPRLGLVILDPGAPPGAGAASSWPARGTSLELEPPRAHHLSSPLSAGYCCNGSDLSLHPQLLIKSGFLLVRSAAMDDEISKLGQLLALSSDEVTGWEILLDLWNSDTNLPGFCVVGRLFSHKSFHFEALRSTLTTTFNSIGGMDMKMIDENHFLVHFDHHVDMKRVLDNSPWAFEKNLIVLQPVATEENPMNVILDWCDFHVLIHDLLLGKMNKEVATFIGNQIGRFKEVEMVSASGLWGSSLWIKVSLNITKPLKLVLRLHTGIGQEQLITFTYEKLPNFCYLCGCLGHLVRSCKLQLQSDFIDPGENSPFWTMASSTPPLPGRKQIPSIQHPNLGSYTTPT
ncbi:hypothetical protein Salat_2809500 [Sesamum alatum]|uniref:CCHC-type domain-containing protein n=1 Tax=Sesamum alatum TaxID=300844 RepID=A0AAE1XM77_9LAMI|nr:hypothetical protein Salat_2809500 [Sesamum alatum]